MGSGRFLPAMHVHPRNRLEPEGAPREEGWPAPGGTSKRADYKSGACSPRKWKHQSHQNRSVLILLGASNGAITTRIAAYVGHRRDGGASLHTWGTTETEEEIKPVILNASWKENSIISAPFPLGFTTVPGELLPLRCSPVWMLALRRAL